MRNEENYRQIAAVCVRLAEETTDQESKVAFLNMASAWLKLADQAERNSKTDVVYEPPLPKAPRQPVAQQQQQIQPDKEQC